MRSHRWRRRRLPKVQVEKWKEITPSPHGFFVHEVLALGAEGLQVREEVRAAEHGLAREFEGRAEEGQVFLLDVERLGDDLRGWSPPQHAGGGRFVDFGPVRGVPRSRGSLARRGGSLTIMKTASRGRGVAPTPSS